MKKGKLDWLVQEDNKENQRLEAEFGRPPMNMTDKIVYVGLIVLTATIIVGIVYAIAF